MKTKLTFTEELASDIEHEAGAHRIDFAATPPNVGDHLRIRLAPSGRVLELRCIGRRFDFASGGEPRLFVHCARAGG